MSFKVLNVNIPSVYRSSFSLDGGYYLNCRTRDTSWYAITSRAVLPPPLETAQSQPIGMEECHWISVKQILIGRRAMCVNWSPRSGNKKPVSVNISRHKRSAFLERDIDEFKKPTWIFVDFPSPPPALARTTSDRQRTARTRILGIWPAK